MGATNAIAAYQRYAGKVPGLSLAVLVYMALVSKDKDAWPWFTLGQHALAEHALGRAHPNAADLRAVQRAIGPLIEAEAVTVDRAGAARSDGNSTARYRLNLHDEADKARREWLDTPDGKRRMSNPHKARRDPTVSDGDTRRKVTRDPTVSDETPDGNRRAKETQGDRRSEKTKEEVVDLPTASHSPRVAAPGEPAPVIPLFPGTANAPGEPPYRSPWHSRRDHAADAVTEAMERQAAKRAAHQARLEATPAEEIS
jgi:hypothetical protein